MTSDRNVIASAEPLGESRPKAEASDVLAQRVISAVDTSGSGGLLLVPIAICLMLVVYVSLAVG